MIQEIDCDVEPMSESDFIEDGIESIDQDFFGHFTREHILYSLNIMRLHKVGPNRLMRKANF